MARRYAHIDFEFTRVSESNLRLVCCSLLVEGASMEEYWLDDNLEDTNKLINRLRDLQHSHVFHSFNVEAEASSFLSLGINPLDFSWVDTYLEYLMFRNHNHSILYGEHFIKGKVKKLTPFVDEKGGTNLGSALYKLCGVVIDSENKDKMRDLIISDPPAFSDKDKRLITAYCSSDVVHLPKLLQEIGKLAVQLGVDREKYFDEAKLRARYACHSAHLVRRGYPINVDWAKNFSESVDFIIDDCIRDINGQFPEILPFKWNRKDKKWSMNQKAIRGWIKEQNFPRWVETNSGAISLALEAWTDHFNYSHTYPEGNFGAQMVRFLKLKQSLNGFVEKSERKTKSFWDSVGSDGRVRPYYNIFGSQSSRSQPAATGYLFLKPAWQRALVQAPQGRAIIGADYGSEEFLIKALSSNDESMIEAYRSGDVYLAFAKDAGMVPRDGTKKEYQFERDLCKSTVLGLSYLMSNIGLARKLTQDTGQETTEEDAQDLIDMFNEAYCTAYEWVDDLLSTYGFEGKLKLKDGWYMFGDNTNFRSVANMPIQGAGADIMRRAVEECYQEGLEVILTLHDALYIECDIKDIEEVIPKFKRAMKKGFTSYFDHKDADIIRIDLKGWGIGLEGEEVGGLKFSEIHIDERAVREYEKFSKYFFEKSYLSVL